MNFIRKETPTQLFFCEYCEIFKSTYFEESLRISEEDLLLVVLQIKGE